MYNRQKMGESNIAKRPIWKVIGFSMGADLSRYEELEPSASLHNVILKIAESHGAVSQMLQTTVDDIRIMLVESYLGFCKMARKCGDSDDLVVALAKTGFLEQMFEDTRYAKEVYPAVLAERAEILWKRHERIEAIHTLRSIVDASANELSFTIIPKELVLANLVPKSL